MTIKDIVTDLRIGLAAVLAAQSVVVDTLTNLGVSGKVISSILGGLGLLATIVQVVSENAPQTSPAPPAPTVVPPKAG